jgi:transketolase
METQYHETTVKEPGLHRVFHELDQLALLAREHILHLAAQGGCFIGSGASCVDILVYLYSQFLHLDQIKSGDTERDYFFLSKGHAVPALYATFAALGIMDPDRLENHLEPSDRIYWHPNVQIPCVEFHSGSLGHLLPVAVGVALDIRMRNQNNWVAVLTGDGELNEGSNWEALLVSHAYQLGNLVLIVDRNRIQANLPTESLIPLEPLAEKFRSFGCHVIECDGHDFTDLHEVFSSLQARSDKPHVIIANTLRGKGFPSLEGRTDRWFYQPSPQEVIELMDELYGQWESSFASYTHS